MSFQLLHETNEKLEHDCVKALAPGDIDEDYLQSLEGAGRGKGRKIDQNVAEKVTSA